MKQLLISVIIPLYNSEQYIAETIESVLNQKDIGYEIIIVDDGSTDHSADICRRYLRENVILFQQKNSGAPSARNKGMENAVGKYLLFLDSDDLLYDGLFEALEDYIREDKDCIIGSFIRMSNNGDIEDQSRPRDQQIASFYWLPPYPCNKLFKRKKIIQNELRFADVRLTQDLNFYFKFLGTADADSISAISVPFARYRWVEGSISHTVSKKILDIIISVDDCINYYRTHNAEARLKYLYLASMRHVCYQIEKTAFFKDKAEGKAVRTQLLEYWKSLKARTPVFHNKFYFLKKQKANLQLIYTLFMVRSFLIKKRS